MWIDLSITLNQNTTRWPNSSPFIIQTKTENTCTNSVLTCSTHAGTHIDAPLHFIENGLKINQIPLSDLCGLTQVISVSSDQINPDHLQNISAPKVIFKTNNYVDGEFNADYCFITPEAARRLVDLKVQLIGVDYLSIENFYDKQFTSHHILLRSGIIIIEGLNTDHVQEGLYEMIALPLKIEAEASPARVIVRPLE